ncbi:hypothetical protein ACGC1H_003531 [Rhizoctonia solani]|uniref:Uncharacterized protein n=1 Tax=Rhizoctonia solani TaxID=456999 RepID=A0A8H3BQM8_9AGAM|nr:unnamed protein product [Rhizoctonia solani]
MSPPSELDSPLPTPLWAPLKRQFPNPNSPPPIVDPGRVATTSQTSAAASYTASLVPVATTATVSAVNTRSLVFDPSATSVVDVQSATPTNSTGDSNNQSILEKLFTPNGGLFTVGIIILSLAVLALITCAIVTIRCTLRSRRRSRMRSRAQSFTEKNVARRPISSDRASEFWSAGANQSIRERTMSGDNAAGVINLSINSQYPPTRPVRSGETEADLRAPGRIHFTPSVMMSDHTGLSMDVQHGSVRTSGANMDTNLPNPSYTNSAVAPTNSAIPGQSGRRASAATYTLDQDPFAASPIISVPAPVKPLSINRATPSPYVYNSPHTPSDSSSQFAVNFNSSPSNSAASPSETAALGSSFGSTNMLGLTSSSSSTPYIPTNMTTPLEIPTSAARYDSGRDTIMSDPFAYDNMVRSRAPTLGGASYAAPFPSPGVTWTNVDSGVASPPALHIAPASPGIQTGPLPSPYLPSPLLGSSAASPALIPVPLLSASLQHDVSQALSQLQRRMSASTVATRFSQQTEYQYRTPLGTVSDDERSFGYFMQGSPGGPKRSLPFVPRLNGSAHQAPESLQMQPTKTQFKTPEYGSPVYSSTTSVFDTYYQGSEYNSRSRSGTRS